MLALLEPFGEGQVPEQNGGSVRKEGTGTRDWEGKPSVQVVCRPHAKKHCLTSSRTVGAVGKVISVVQMRK